MDQKKEITKAYHVVENSLSCGGDVKMSLHLAVDTYGAIMMKITNCVPI